MSKIFDALLRGHSQVSETVLSALHDIPSLPAEEPTIGTEEELAEIIDALTEPFRTEAANVATDAHTTGTPVYCVANYSSRGHDCDLSAEPPAEANYAVDGDADAD